jgi:hypothetical protein
MDKENEKLLAETTAQLWADSSQEKDASARERKERDDK